jgi:Na+/melibiose symporter-like transporter
MPEEMQGRMFSLMTIVMSTAGLIGAAVAGPVSDAFGPHLAMVLAGMLCIGATLFTFGWGKGARVFMAMPAS